MSSPISRRSFLKGIAAGAIIVGFDPINRTWVTEAEAAPSHTISIPGLQGVLYTDSAHRNAAADDYGHIISKVPVAVLKPASENDIAKVIRFARRHNLKVAGRGQGHSTYGQPQVENGIVIDMSGLNRIISIKNNYADVEAGVVWHDLLLESLKKNLTPPVMTDYIDLSVGGTLTVGGISGATHQQGLQVDNVLELHVVTGEGKKVTCSPTKKADLFYSVLAGQGQYGIITRARVRLVEAKQKARVFMLYYNDLTTFTNDQKLLINQNRFNYVEGQVVADESGGWQFMLEATVYYNPSNPPNNAALLADLNYDPATAVIEDKSYYEFVNRLAPTVEFLKSVGAWYLPHPWYDVFIPSSKVVQYLSDLLANLTLADTGQGPILLYPIKTSKLNCPFFRVPDEPIVFLFDILRTAPSHEAALDMVQQNRQFYETLRDLGGNRYVIGAIPFTSADWQLHYGPVWPLVVAAKNKYDPDRVLTPGQGIFS